MTKLISEGLFTDGSFQLSKVLEQTNDRLGKLGKHGKRAKLKQSKNSIVLQFSFEGKQHQKGINCSFTKGGIIEAEKIAGLVTSQLSASSFTWEWFNNLIGKKVNTEETKPTCKQLISQYKTHWFQENKKLKKLPEGAIFNGYRDYDVQDLVLKRHNIRFLLAEYVTVEGKTIVGKLPKEYQGHYGPTLMSFTLYQHHQCRVPQNLICEQRARVRGGYFHTPLLTAF